MFNMILKDLRISPLRSVLTGVSMFVGIIAMICSVLVGTLGKEYLVSVNAQISGKSPTYSFSVSEASLDDPEKLRRFLDTLNTINDAVSVTFFMDEEVKFAPVASSPIKQDAYHIYKALTPVEAVFTTEKYNEIYNLPVFSGTWLSNDSALEIVANKEAATSYFKTDYVVGGTSDSLALTPFRLVGIVNDGRNFSTLYLNAAAVLELAPNLWTAQGAYIYWHSANGLTPEQMNSALRDILDDSIGGTLTPSGRSDLGESYASVLSILQMGLLVTAVLLLFVSILGQINIGLSSLEQRTHELLIRRAIGASQGNIVLLVLGSQMILSIFVCIAAIVLSFSLVECIGLFLPVDSPVTVPGYPVAAAITAVGASIITALLGGLFPAIKASKLEPALVLR